MTDDEAESRFQGLRHFIDSLSTFYDFHGSRVLDVGCGSGGLLLAAIERGACEVVGIDRDLDLFGSHLFDDLARRHRISGNHRILQDDFAVTNQLEENSFDYILSIDTLEHVEDPIAIVRQMHRFLKPAGVAVIDIGALYYGYNGGHVWGYFPPEEMPWVHLYRDYPELADRASLSPWMEREVAALNRVTFSELKEAILATGFQIGREFKNSWGRDQIDKYRDRIDFTQIPSEEDLFMQWVQFHCSK